MAAEEKPQEQAQAQAQAQAQVANVAPECAANCALLLHARKAVEARDQHIKKVSATAQDAEQQRQVAMNRSRRGAAELLLPNLLLLPFMWVPEKYRQVVLGSIAVLFLVVMVMLSTVTLFGGHEVIEKKVLVTPPAYAEMLDFVQELGENDATAVKLFLPATREAYDDVLEALEEGDATTHEGN